MEEFERSLFDPAMLMAQAPVPGKQYNAIDFIEQFGPLTASTHGQTPWRGLSTEDAAHARAMSSMPSPTPPGLGLAILGTALGLRNLTGDTPQRASTNYGMGVGGGPDAANMSLDDFGILDSFDPDDMSMAMASVENDPWGYNQSVIDALNASYDTGAISSVSGPEAGGEALAQRAAETIIAQQAARQVTPQSNKVTIPTSSGPDIVIDVTPPAPQTSVAPQRRAAPKPSPVKVAATSIAKPKAFKKLPKFAQKEIRKGKVPTTGSDYVQDMVRDFLGGQKAVGDSGTRK